MVTAALVTAGLESCTASGMLSSALLSELATDQQQHQEGGSNLRQEASWWACHCQWAASMPS